MAGSIARVILAVAIAGVGLSGLARPVLAQATVRSADQPSDPDPTCPKPALDRMIRHKVARGETLTTIADRYGLLPETIMGFNPASRQGTVQPGQVLDVPPYNGIVVAVPQALTWRDVAQLYRVRPETLYELNGCGPVALGEIFVPGQVWSPDGVDPAPIASQQPGETLTPDRLGDGHLAANNVSTGLDRYPLNRSPGASLDILQEYGWQVNPETNQVEFSPSLVLAGTPGEIVVASAGGTVAFAGPQTGYPGNLVVINHEGGRQTRYANLAGLAVRRGQTVRSGDRLGSIAPPPSSLGGSSGSSGSTNSGLSPGLTFELRTNSSAGWVAQDPKPYLRSILVKSPDRPR